MAKRHKRDFSPAERYAVLSTHGPRCYIGGEPIDMLTFEIDHVIPEELLDHPDGLAEVLTQLGRPSDFGINSFGNWLPACGPCNKRKSAAVFEPSPLIQLHLQNAAGKAPQAQQACQVVVRNQELGKAVVTLMRWAAEEPLPEKVRAEIRPLLEDFVGRIPRDSAGDIVRVTPKYSLPLYELLSDDGRLAVVRGPFGVGGGPSTGVDVGPRMRCGSCGGQFFNGTRCVACGAQDDGD